jgi:hypothetical protein
MNCPLCGTELKVMNGNSMHVTDPKYGVTVWCPGEHPRICPAQEVMGHGNNLREAYEIVLTKYKKETR